MVLGQSEVHRENEIESSKAVVLANAEVESLKAVVLDIVGI